MKYITQKLVNETLDNHPDLTLEVFIEHCKMLNPKWNTNGHGSRFVTQMTEKYNESRANLPLGGSLVNPHDIRPHAEGLKFVVTCAQSNTKVNEKFLKSLETYCKFNDAELLVSRFTYNKTGYGQHSVKVGSKKKADTQDVWWDRALDDYIMDEDIELADDLVFFASLNIIPTRADPLTGFENHGRDKSSIIPHVKMYMRSVPTMKCDNARFMYSTGTVTQRNYIQQAAGQKAELHHVFGALLVEKDTDGNWWVRQLNYSDIDGGFQDLSTVYTPNDIYYRDTTAIVHGDIHGLKMDNEVQEIVFGGGGMLDELQPQYQFFHDIIDFMPRNHHNIKDPHFLHEMYVNDTSSVYDEFSVVGSKFTGYFSRPTVQSYIITSNHDQAITTWLRNTSAFFDPENVEFWLDMNSRCLKAQREGQKPRPFAWALGDAIEKWSIGLDHKPSFAIIDEDESVKLLDIEFGLHGHLGPNGARGAPKNLRTVGKACTGHTHSAGIVDGVYTAGVLGKLDMGYNKGLSSWSHSSIVVYPNGKRTIVTITNGKYKA